MPLRMTHETLGSASCATEAQFHALHEANGWVLDAVPVVAPDPTDEERAAALAEVLAAPVEVGAAGGATDPDPEATETVPSDSLIPPGWGDATTPAPVSSEED